MSFLSPGARQLIDELPADEAAFFEEAFEAGWTLHPDHEPPPAMRRPEPAPMPKQLWWNEP